VSPQVWNAKWRYTVYGCREVRDEKIGVTETDPKTAGQLVLVVEDDDFMRGFLALALQHAGFGVLTASDGLKGYALFKEHLQDLCTDIIMPEVDGIELARRATALRSGLPILFVTGFPEVAARQKSKTD
jgi:two-component system cell cycle response regulator CpdR